MFLSENISKRALLWNFFTISNVPYLGEGILAGRKFDGFDGCGENPSN